MAYDDYNAKVGKAQGAATVFVKEDGYMDFFNSTFTGSRLRVQHLSLDTITRHSTGLSTSALSGQTTLSPGYGYALIRGLSTHLSTNIAIASAVVGARLIINASELEAKATILFLCSYAGVSVVGPGGSSLSTILLSGPGKVTLVCDTVDVWSVVDCNAAILQYA